MLNRTYWGRPDNTYIEIDMNNKFELWNSQIYGERETE